jgi:CRISPR-associated endonuclease Cas2
MTYLVSYDIEDNRTRGRLARYLEQKGRRLQKSVFTVELEQHKLKELIRELGKLAGVEGEVAIFRLCHGCAAVAIRLGGEERTYCVY